MNRLDKLKTLATDSVAETNILLSEKPSSEVLNMINKIESIINGSDPLKILTIKNYDVFYIFVHEMNIEEFSEEEIKSYCKEIEQQVNTWSFYKNGKDFENLYNKTNADNSFSDTSCIKHFQNLGLPPIFLELDMKLVYAIMHQFIEFKTTIDENNKHYDEEKSSSNPLLLEPVKTVLKDRKEFLKGIISKMQFPKSLSIIKENILNKIKEYETNRPVLLERKRVTKELLSRIENGSLETIIEIPSSWHQYLDPKVLKELYEIINENLCIKNKQLIEEEQSIEQIISTNPFIKYCYENGIDPKSVDDRLKEIPNIIDKINFFKELNLSLNEILTTYSRYLYTLESEVIEQLNTWLKLHVISKNTIKNNLDELTTSFSRVKLNYEILKDIVDFKNQFYSDTILLIDNRELQNRLSVLKEYNLSLSNYMFLLCNYDYLSIYDLMIENNIPDYLLITICRTTNPLNTIKRIKLYQSIDEQIETPSHTLRKELTSESRFLIPDEKLDEYVPNIVPSLILEPMKGYKITNKPNLEIERYNRGNYYEISGIRISRPKFLRNFESKKHNSSYFITSLVSSSILDSSEYFALITEIEEKNIKQK